MADKYELDDESKGKMVNKVPPRENTTSFHAGVDYSDPTADMNYNMTGSMGAIRHEVYSQNLKKDFGDSTHNKGMGLPGPQRDKDIRKGVYRKDQ